jgi:hypothetical protein
VAQSKSTAEIANKNILAVRTVLSLFAPDQYKSGTILAVFDDNSVYYISFSGTGINSNDENTIILSGNGNQLNETEVRDLVETAGTTTGHFDHGYSVNFSAKSSLTGEERGVLDLAIDNSGFLSLNSAYYNENAPTDGPMLYLKVSVGGIAKTVSDYEGGAPVGFQNINTALLELAYARGWIEMSAPHVTLADNGNTSQGDKVIIVSAISREISADEIQIYRVTNPTGTVVSNANGKVITELTSGAYDIVWRDADNNGNLSLNDTFELNSGILGIGENWSGYRFIIMEYPVSIGWVDL